METKKIEDLEMETKIKNLIEKIDKENNEDKLYNLLYELHKLKIENKNFVPIILEFKIKKKILNKMVKMVVDNPKWEKIIKNGNQR